MEMEAAGGAAGGAELCFPLLSNTSCRRPLPPPPPHHSTDVLVHVTLALVSGVTAILNMLVIISITHFRQLHSPTHLLLLSLAVSDLLVGLLLMPAEILSTRTCWVLGDLVCVLYYLVDFIITSSSVGNVVLISVDRYLAVCDPLHYPSRVTLDRARACIGLCWICSSVYSAGLILSAVSGSGSACRGQCVLVLDHLTVTVDFVVNFSGPITVIVVLYLRVFVVAVSQARAVHAAPAHVPVQQRSVAVTVSRSELKAAKTLGVVVLVFLLCLCPYYAPSLLGADVEESTSSSPVELWLLYINSCLNPLIYATLYPWFRRSVRLIVTLQILQPNSCRAKIL